MGLIQKLIDWASRAINWLKNFFRHIWNVITGWWSRLKTWVKSCIQSFKEIVLLDAREDGGRELIEAIQEAQPETVTIDDIDNGPVAVSIGYDNTVEKVDNFQADPQQEDNYDSMQHQKNGILRITG